MNEDRSIATGEDLSDAGGCDPLQTEDPCPADPQGDGGETEPCRPCVEDPAVPADPPQDPDPDSESAETVDPLDLKAEVERLRGELAARDDFLRRMGAECAEFQALYPSTPVSTLPDSVWEDVKKGIPMAAAYALAERKRALTAEKADTQNRAVSRLSAGAVEGTVPEYFSPSEVRAMSPSEVRANYKKIMRSMEKWH